MMFRRKRLRHIARKLTTDQLQQESDGDDSLENFSLFDLGHRASNRFLGYYSKAGLQLAFEKYGLMKELARRGFGDVRLHVDTQDPFVHRLRFDDHQLSHEMVIGELVVRRESLVLPVPANHPLARQNFAMLAIEWLYLQDPRIGFDTRRPQLPGQKHPGLGLAKMVLELLLIVCRRLNLAGLLNHPAHFHNAYMGAPVFRFTNPLVQARFEALHRDLQPYHLQASSWAVAWECVRDAATGKPLVWEPDRYMIPLDRQLKDYVRSAYYQQRCRDQMDQYRFELDDAGLRNHAAKSGIFIPRIYS